MYSSGHGLFAPVSLPSLHRRPQVGYIGGADARAVSRRLFLYVNRASIEPIANQFIMAQTTNQPMTASDLFDAQERLRQRRLRRQRALFIPRFLREAAASFQLKGAASDRAYEIAVQLGRPGNERASPRSTRKSRSAPNSWTRSSARDWAIRSRRPAPTTGNWNTSSASGRGDRRRGPGPVPEIQRAAGGGRTQGGA